MKNMLSSMARQLLMCLDKPEMSVAIPACRVVSIVSRVRDDNNWCTARQRLQ